MVFIDLYLDLSLNYICRISYIEKRPIFAAGI